MINNFVWRLSGIRVQSGQTKINDKKNHIKICNGLWCRLMVVSPTINLHHKTSQKSKDIINEGFINQRFGVPIAVDTEVYT